MHFGQNLRYSVNNGGFNGNNIQYPDSVANCWCSGCYFIVVVTLALLLAGFRYLLSPLEKRMESLEMRMETEIKEIKSKLDQILSTQK